MPQIINAPILNLALVLNKPGSISTASGCSSSLLIRLITIINTAIIRKTIPILSINGIFGPPISGKNFNKVDNGIVKIAAHIAAGEEVFFQKKPKKKMANTPGETNPVYS